LSSLAFVLKGKGDFAGAEPVVRRALSLAEKTFGVEHPEVAKQSINLAWLLNAKGDHQGAQALYHRALPVTEKALGPDNPLVQAIRKSLAELERYNDR
jgi:hypothetical protein